MLFATSAVALAVALGNRQLLSPDLALLSAGAVIPGLIGMGLGQIVRRRLSESLFRRVFFCALLLMGTYIVIANGLRVAGG